MTETYRVVFSTDQPLLCPSCNKKRNKCKCKSETNDQSTEQGSIRVQREVKRRGGKMVTVITGLPLSYGEMKELLVYFKQIIGCGGTVKNGRLELQGDRVNVVLEELARKGYVAKQAGG